jgi:hypothetical protein
MIAMEQWMKAALIASMVKVENAIVFAVLVKNSA